MDSVLEQIKRGCVELLVESEFEERLKLKRPLRIKLGVDPTSPDIHLGHTVVINKLRNLQDLGHDVLFLIGDFTATIGDPSGRSVTRPRLTAEEVASNAQSYQDQVFKILDPNKTQVMFNSTWMDTLSAKDLIRLGSVHTVARMLERDDFEKRYRAGKPIAIHEFLYPIVQGYDSVQMKADLELGGTDQKFNVLMGREMQKQFGQPPQCVMIMPILEGLDGVKKMSKSLNNYIGITEAPTEMFGKIMSVSDELMWRYFELLSFRSLGDIASLSAAVADGRNPRDVKFELAEELIERFHSKKEAQAAKQDFIDRFRNNELPTDLEEITLEGEDGALGIAYILKGAGLVSSTSDAFRMLRQGAVKIDGQRVTDSKISIEAGSEHIYQVGKRRVAKVTVS